MGVLSLLLGADNPVAKYATQNHNLLSQWGAGLAAGPTFSAGLSKAAQLGPEGQRLDDANAASIEAEQQRQEQLNQTTKFLQAKFPDLGAALASGAPLPEVWGEAMKRMGPTMQPGMQMGPNGSQVPVPNGKEAFDRSDALWKEYQAVEPVKSYQAVRNGYERLRSAATQQNGAGDVSMIFAYMKMLDPTSVVREGEFATAEQTAGIPAQLTNLYNKLLDGQRLTPEQRKQFISAGDGLYKESVQNLQTANDQFTKRGSQWGADTGFITTPESYPAMDFPTTDYKTKYGLD